MSTLLQMASAALVSLALIFPPSGAARAQSVTEEQILVEKAKATVDAFTAQADMEEMRKLLARARGVVVFPQILKAGFILGAEGGSGVLLGRDGKTGAWTAPAFYTMGAASIGFQAGAEASEVMLLIMSDRALNAVIEHQVKLGADASIAVGPIGKGMGASTTTNLNADIYSFARTKGLFGGVSLDGAIIKARESMMQAYYGQPATARQVVLLRQLEAPHAAPLQQSLQRAEIR
ncbi:MAG: lipid-binding SYLF domain-containing protein [Alphaproteobacteria bacterium]|nr:lipid-binding SYLF domain-containing protein [Alphaproteobacteria bacterium]